MNSHDANFSVFLMTSEAARAASVYNINATADTFNTPPKSPLVGPYSFKKVIIFHFLWGFKLMEYQ